MFNGRKLSDGKRLRIRFIEEGLRFIDVVRLANPSLPANRQLSEAVLSKICTDRRRPTIEDAEAFARILGDSVESLFPSTDFQDDTAKRNRCSRCGQFCGNQWGATDAGRMSKRAESLICEQCIRKTLQPDLEGGQ